MLNKNQYKIEIPTRDMKSFAPAIEFEYMANSVKRFRDAVSGKSSSTFSDGFGNTANTKILQLLEKALWLVSAAFFLQFDIRSELVVAKRQGELMQTLGQLSLAYTQGYMKKIEGIESADEQYEKWLRDAGFLSQNETL